MTIKFHPFSDFIVVVGRKGRGKTVFVIFLVKLIRRKIIIDPTWQMGSLGYCVHFPERIIPAFKEYGCVIYQPKKMTVESYDLAFEACSLESNYTLVIDEIDKFARPRWYISTYLNEIINRGRAQGIGLVCNSRRPHKMHNDVRSNADYVVCFHLHEERDRKYMAEWMAIDPEAIKDLESKYGEHSSFLYDVRRAETIVQAPCPNYT